jgi:hypothetical protein
LRRRRRLQIRRRRGRLHRLWRSARLGALAGRSRDDTHVLGASDAEPQKQETKRGSQLGLHGTTPNIRRSWVHLCSTAYPTIVDEIALAQQANIPR